MSAATACFVAGTPVQMGDGSTRPIEQVHTGDVVASRNLKTEATEAKRVTGTTVKHAAELVTLQLTDSATAKVVETITCTPDHPFFVKGRSFVAAGALGIGTQVVTRAGPALRVSGEKRSKPVGGASVYNLTVVGDHTYFVGVANVGACVHNEDCLSIARRFARGGEEVYRLTPKYEQYVMRAVDPVRGPLDSDGAFARWKMHAVHVQDGMVRDPMMTGNNKAIPMEDWQQKYWNDFDSHNFVPDR